MFFLFHSFNVLSREPFREQDVYSLTARGRLVPEDIQWQGAFSARGRLVPGGI